MSEPKKRYRTITIRHATPSRGAIFLVVAQMQDEMGRWQTPTITFEGPMLRILESGRYAHDVGDALIVASFFFDEYMRVVDKDEANKNVSDQDD